MLIDENGNKIETHHGGSIRGVSNADIQRMLDFLLGAVRAICAEREGTQFAARDFLGGANYFWQGTPVEILFEKYIAEGYSAEAAIEEAGKSAGHLLKRVLIEDRNRTYQLGDAGMANGYTWLGDGPRH